MTKPADIQAAEQHKFILPTGVPQETWSHIFSYLTPQDTARSSPICKFLVDISQARIFAKVDLSLTPKAAGAFVQTLSTRPDLSSYTRELVFLCPNWQGIREEAEFFDGYLPTLSQRLPNVRRLTLSIRSCDSFENHSSSLEILVAGLTHLCIALTHLPSLAALDRLMVAAPHLRCVRLSQVSVRRPRSHFWHWDRSTDDLSLRIASLHVRGCAGFLFLHLLKIIQPGQLRHLIQARSTVASLNYYKEALLVHGPFLRIFGCSYGSVEDVMELSAAFTLHASQLIGLGVDHFSHSISWTRPLLERIQLQKLRWLLCVTILEKEEVIAPLYEDLILVVAVLSQHWGARLPLLVLELSGPSSIIERLVVDLIDEISRSPHCSQAGEQFFHPSHGEDQHEMGWDLQGRWEDPTTFDAWLYYMFTGSSENQLSGQAWRWSIELWRRLAPEPAADAYAAILIRRG